MREHYDFSDAIKNPFVGKKEKGKFNVLVTYDSTYKLQSNVDLWYLIEEVAPDEIDKQMMLEMENDPDCDDFS